MYVMADAEQPDFTTLTVQLLTAYVSNNTVPIDQLPALIESTRAVLAKRDEPQSAETTPEEFVPAISVRKSLASPEYIISMIDGKPYRTLKRHLSTHGLTPADYRNRYKLPADYPMVAPAYSEARRDTAKRLGLGRKPGQTAAQAKPETDGPAPVAAATPKRARRKATAAETT